MIKKPLLNAKSVLENMRRKAALIRRKGSESLEYCYKCVNVTQVFGRVYILAGHVIIALMKRTIRSRGLLFFKGLKSAFLITRAQSKTDFKSSLRGRFEEKSCFVEIF